MFGTSAKDVYGWPSCGRGETCFETCSHEFFFERAIRSYFFGCSVEAWAKTSCICVAQLYIYIYALLVCVDRVLYIFEVLINNGRPDHAESGVNLWQFP